MNEKFYAELTRQLQDLRERNLYKEERAICSPQGREVAVASRQTGEKKVINMCANNYLGFAAHEELIRVATAAPARYGYGLASVRFICGTQEIHAQLERKIAAFLGTEDAILYSSCFDANTGLFEVLLDERDAIISDALNHASIIDGIRLCKAKRYRYRNSDMTDLEKKLQEAGDCRFRLIATDGVFSMDGTIARLPEICALAVTHRALVMVDDSHAVGIMGERGAGSVEYHGVEGQVDIITGTLGKALGGASGGYVAGRKEVIAVLRQKSRPYLFSNTLAPVIVSTSLHALQMLGEHAHLRAELVAKSRFLRHGLLAAGFEVCGDAHPIIPVMVCAAETAQKMAAMLYEAGVYAPGFFYPVVPEGKARIRLQVSAAHTQEDLDFVLATFIEIGQKMGIGK